MIKVSTFANMNTAASYPHYRRYKNNKVYFKIISDTEWEELHVSKNACTMHSFVAKILPDRNYLADMTFDYAEHWERIEERDYEEMKKNCLK